MAAAAASLRSIGSRFKGFPGWLLQCQKVKKRPISFIQNKAGIWVLEDACRKEGPFAKMKAKINQGWDYLDDRVKGIILENIIKPTLLTIWGAGVFTVTRSLERLGLVDTGLSNATNQKELITAIVKVENEKTLEKLRQQRAEDKAMLSKLAEEFDSHRKLTKVWLARLIENTVDPSSKEEIAKFLKVFSLYDKDGDGMITLDEARSVMETLTDNMSESQLHKLVAESGRIALPDLLKFMVDKYAEARKQTVVAAEESSSSS